MMGEPARVGSADGPVAGPNTDSRSECSIAVNPLNLEVRVADATRLRNNQMSDSREPRSVVNNVAPENACQPATGNGPEQVLSLGDASAIIVGLVIGAGIFKAPSMVAGASGGELAMTLCWVAGGVLSLIGAMCYAELATAYPSAGGEYHFIGRAFGRLPAFFYAWARMTVIVAGSIAVFAFIFGDYCTRLLDLGPHSPSIYAALIVSALTAVNVTGIRAGKNTQNLFTALVVLGLVAVLTAGLLLAPEIPPGSPPAPSQDPPSWSGIGLAMIFVLFTYGGWNDGAYISAEVRDRERNMSRALFLSIGLVTALYVLVNLAYVRGLGFAGVGKSEAVAADLLARVWGEAGDKVISVTIAIATLTSINGAMIVGARSNYALGREWPLLNFLGRWDEASGSPRNAYLAQGAIALTLVGLGTIQRKGFETLVDFTAPVFWTFFLLTGASLFVLRAKEPAARRPYRVPFYPLTPALFVASCVYLLYSSLVYTGSGALVGIGVLAAGAILLLFGRRPAR
jgi:APA family basic amino acid/polyamine antiporter